MDLTIRSPLASSQQHQPNLLQNAATAKTAKYQRMAQECQAQFVPFAMSVYGEIEKQGLDFLDFLLAQAPSRLPASATDPVLTRPRMFQRLSMILHKHNAWIVNTWLGRSRIHAASSSAASEAMLAGAGGQGLFDEGEE